MRTTGSILILVSFWGVACYLANNLKKKTLCTENMLAFFKHIKNQIEFFNSSLPDIYDSFNSENKPFFIFVKSLKNNSWTSALDTSPKLIYDKKTKEIIKSFGAELGTTDRCGQLAHCNYYINLLEQEYQKLQKDAKNKIKTIYALCLYAALMLLILFL